MVALPYISMVQFPSVDDVSAQVLASYPGLMLVCLVAALYLLRQARIDKALRLAHEGVVHAIAESDLRLRWSTMELAEKLRNREVTSEEMVDLYINQINAVNPALNAAVGQSFEAARRQAQWVDAEIARCSSNGNTNTLPELMGVPFISKEVFEYPDFPFTGGIFGRRHQKGKKINPVLNRLLTKGAIILACGNTSEACMWFESSNPVHGVTNMPYDLRRTCGGSSGGTSALVSSLCGSFGVTSDVGGSTRIPALYNGVFGHKPTGGAVPNMRTLPIVHGKVESYCQLGPTARYARDLFPLLRIMAGPVESNELIEPTSDEVSYLAKQRPFMKSLSWPDPCSVDMRKLKFYVVWDQPGTVLGVLRSRDPAMQEAQERVVQALEASLGVEVHPVEFKGLKRAFNIWSAMLQEAQEVPFVEIISEGLGYVLTPIWEIFKGLATCGLGTRHTFPALGLALVERFKDLVPKEHLSNLSKGSDLRLEMNDLLGDNGVLIFPSLPTPAPLHGPLPNLLFFADCAATAILNVMEVPATAVPTGLSRDKHLPTGVQLVAANGNDHLTIATAMHLENIGIVGWKPPRTVLP